MITLLNRLYDTISQSTTYKVWYERNSSQTIQYPYVVYNLPTSNDLETDRQDFILEIDVWDRNTNRDQMRIEQLTSDIERHLHKARLLDGDQLLIFTRINRLSLPDPDVQIMRRQLRFEVKRYER